MAIIVTAENMIGSTAARPSDIYFHKSGKSVQIDNTDAEGRLILIDGLFRAGEEGVDTVVDIATLTGAAERALGQSVAVSCSWGNWVWSANIDESDFVSKTGRSSE